MITSRTINKYYVVELPKNQYLGLNWIENEEEIGHFTPFETPHIDEARKFKDPKDIGAGYLYRAERILEVEEEIIVNRNIKVIIKDRSDKLNRS